MTQVRLKNLIGFFVFFFILGLFIVAALAPHTKLIPDYPALAGVLEHWFGFALLGSAGACALLD